MNEAENEWDEFVVNGIDYPAVIQNLDMTCGIMSGNPSSCIRNITNIVSVKSNFTIIVQRGSGDAEIQINTREFSDKAVIPRVRVFYSTCPPATTGILTTDEENSSVTGVGATGSSLTETSQITGGNTNDDALNSSNRLLFNPISFLFFVFLFISFW